MTSSCNDRSAVKQYSCLYTPDLKKKNKKWIDGFVKLHHYNARCFLLTSDKAVVAETFYRPAGWITRKLVGQGADLRALDDAFLLQEAEEFEFEAGGASLQPGYLVEVGELVDERSTDLTALHFKTRQARDESLLYAHKWGQNVDSLPPRPRIPVPSQSNPASNQATVQSKPSSNQTKSIPVPVQSTKSTYKGFGVPPPKSYHQSSTSTSKKSRNPILPLDSKQPVPTSENPATKNPPRFSFSASKTHQQSPYSRPPPPATTAASSFPKHLHSSTAHLNINTPNRISKLSSVPNSKPSPTSNGTPRNPLMNLGGIPAGASTAASSPFKPPTFVRKPK